MSEGILIGGAGGTIAGLAIWLIQLLTMKVTERADKKRVTDIRFFIVFNFSTNCHQSCNNDNSLIIITNGCICYEFDNI